MSTYQMIVRINAHPDCDDEFNRWYDDEHIAHVMAVPEFRTCRRYRVVHTQGERPFKYCTIFDIETNDIDAVIASLRARVADGRMPLSPALNPNVEFNIVEPIVK